MALTVTRVLAFMALSAAAVSPVLAADSPPVAPADPETPAVYNWSGIYAGIHAGTAWVDHDTDSGRRDEQPPVMSSVMTNGGGTSGRGEDSKFGFIGGAQLGVNYQLTRFVVGLETDFSLLEVDVGDEQVEDSGDVMHNGGGDRAEFDAGWFATVRGRLGFTLAEFLIYGTGGAAFTDAGFERSSGGGGGDGTMSNSSNRNKGGKDDGTNIGLALGGGIEGMLSQRWTYRLEYLFARFDGNAEGGSADRCSACATKAGGGGETEDAFSVHTIRAGLNCKFSF
jgi:outer membrane immunogenic protein